MFLYNKQNKYMDWWMFGNMNYFSCWTCRISYSWDILVNTRNKFHISAHPCTILYLFMWWLFYGKMSKGTGPLKWNQMQKKPNIVMSYLLAASTIRLHEISSFNHRSPNSFFLVGTPQNWVGTHKYRVYDIFQNHPQRNMKRRFHDHLTLERDLNLHLQEHRFIALPVELSSHWE